MQYGDKTILQMAKSVGISKDALQKRLSREPLKSAVQGHTYTERGTIYLRPEAQTLIKSAVFGNYGQMAMDEVTDNGGSKSPGTSMAVDMYRFLKDELEKKDNDIESKNAQIMELHRQLDNRDEQINKFLDLYSQQQELQLKMQQQLDQMQLQLPPPKHRWPWQK